jgi:hypothetical protein
MCIKHFVMHRGLGFSLINKTQRLPSGRSTWAKAEARLTVARQVAILDLSAATTTTTLAGVRPLAGGSSHLQGVTRDRPIIDPLQKTYDNVVIKTRNPDGLIADLEETFSSLYRFRWKLNPTKCVFGVPSGKLLGFIVSNWGIKANPMKIMAITDMGAPATIKDVQKLTGYMAALNRFISRLGERRLPFFKLLKCQDKF